MFKINDNYLKLPGSYLFSTIAKKVAAYKEANPEKKDQIISNLQAEISYLKAKLFGTSSEKVNGKSVLPINF